MKLLGVVALFVLADSLITEGLSADVMGYASSAGIDMLCLSLIAKHCRTSAGYTVCNIYLFSAVICLSCAAISLLYQQDLIDFDLYLSAYNFQYQVAIGLTVLSLLVSFGSAVGDGIRRMGNPRFIRLLGFVAFVGVGS